MAFRAFILTASDAGSRGEREDKSAPAAQKLLEAAGYEIAGYAMLPDDRAQLADKMREVCDNDLADLLVTTGGTGFSARDCTPEATADVTERAVPGIPGCRQPTEREFTVSIVYYITYEETGHEKLGKMIIPRCVKTGDWIGGKT